MIWRASNFSFVDETVRADVSENNTAFRHGESEPVFLCDIAFPNVLPAVNAVDVQRGVFWVMKKKFKLLIKADLQILWKAAVVFLESIGED